MASRATNLPPEFARIARYFVPLAAAETGAFSLQNDAAMLDVPAGKRLVVTSDSCIEGWHIPHGASATRCAQKLMRRNLSDVAAMGANPWRYSLNLHLPQDTSDDYIAQFADMLHQEQTRFGLVLIGGDSTTGGDIVHTTITMLALADDACHTRSGACVGDDVYVTGTIGDGALALMLLQETISASPENADYLLSRYYTPTPRLEIGAALHGVATSVMDISDGLLADAEHIARASNVSITINTSAVPLSAAAQHHVPKHQQAVLTGGDDYELLFTAPKHAAPEVQHIATQHKAPITKIGYVSAQHDALVSTTD